MLDFNSDEEDKKVFSSLTGSWTDSSFFRKVFEFVSRIVRYTIMKYILSIAFVALLALFFGYSAKDKKLAEDMATQAANDNPIGVWDQFLKVKKPKISITNNHPLYNSEIVKEWEEENKVKFKKIYAYITIKNEEGEKEDLFVMKKRAFDIDSEDRKPLKLERSTTFSTSAKNICENYFGAVPTDYQKKFFDRARHIRIRNIEDELTYENDDGEKFFRCVIDKETIQDLLDE